MINFNIDLQQIIRPTMDLDAFLRQQPFDKLVRTYIELEIKEPGEIKQRIRKELTLVNSILVAVVQNKKGLAQLYGQISCSLQANDDDRKCLQRGGQLLLEITKKSPHLINQSQQILIEVVKLCCQKAFLAACGNVFIQLLHHLATTNSLNSQQIMVEIVQFLTSPKLLTSTYRQVTRLSLYKLYLYVLQKIDYVIVSYGKVEKQFHRIGFIERCISNGSGQKDPRNIGSVFELYLKALQVFKQEQLIKYKSEMFENLQSYYPIEFVGDEQNKQLKKINIKHITRLLDVCLTHPFFVHESWDLLNSKTVGAPIAPFVSTFLLYLQKIQTTPQISIKLKNILFRLSQQQFIAEDYPQSQPDLGNLLTKILQTIIGRDDASYNLTSFETVISWFELMLAKVLNGHFKHSGTMMGIFRSLVRNGKQKKGKILAEMFKVHALLSVINVLSPQNEIVPKLGLVIVALSQLQSSNSSLSELMALLTLKVGKIYPEVTDQLKMLLLKILVEIYQGCPQAKSMVRKVNDSYILKDCLARAKQSFSKQLDSTQTYMVKAFIDFISVVYLNETDSVIQNVLAVNYQLQSYLLGRFAQGIRRQKSLSYEYVNEKMGKIVQKFNFLIVNLKQKRQQQAMMKALSAIDHDSCLYLLNHANWFNKQANTMMIFGLLLQIKKYLRGHQITQQFNQDEPSNRGFIQNFIYNPIAVWERLNSQLSNHIILPSISQIKKLTSQNFVFSDEFLQVYPPTLIHCLWQNYRKIQEKADRQNKSSTLIAYLPQKLLLRDSKQVLQTAINSEGQVVSLLKVVRNLDWQTLKQTGIVEYSLNYLDELCKNESKPTQQSVCMLSIVISILQKQREQGEFKNCLLLRKKALKNLLQHRKRPLRQAARKLLLIIQE